MLRLTVWNTGGFSVFDLFAVSFTIEFGFQNADGKFK